jgi:hypothetical protein
MGNTMSKMAPADVVDTTLWCVNITGPDDVIAVASRAEAVTLAARFNNWWMERFPAATLHPYEPTTWAVPIPYPNSPEGHAEALADRGEYEWLFAEPTPSRESSDELAALAARYLGMEVTDFALHTNSVDPRDPNLVKTFEEIKRLAGSVLSQSGGDDDWIEWSGGECPVSSNTVVTIKRRGGELIERVDGAGAFNWGRYDRPQVTDIIAYRVHPAVSQARGDK